MFSTGSLRHSWLYCLGNSQFLCSRNYSFVGASTFLCNCQLTGSVGEKEKGLGPAHLFLVVAQLHEICPDAPPVALAMAVAGLHCDGDASGVTPTGLAAGRKHTARTPPSARSHPSTPVGLLGGLGRGC